MLGEFQQSVTGSLKPNETPKLAAIRELKEETGIRNPQLVDMQHSVRFRIRPPGETEPSHFLGIKI